jgi:hypothetical protein
MDEKTFQTRTKKLAVAIIKEDDKLPRFLVSDVIGKQLVRSCTFIGANYRDSCVSQNPLQS